MVRLSIHPALFHLFREPVGRSEHERLPCAEEFDCSRGLAGASAAVEVGEGVLGEGVSVAGCFTIGNIVAFSSDGTQSRPRPTSASGLF